MSPDDSLTKSKHKTITCIYISYMHINKKIIVIEYTQNAPYMMIHFFSGTYELLLGCCNGLGCLGLLGLLERDFGPRYQQGAEGSISLEAFFQKAVSCAKKNS